MNPKTGKITIFELRDDVSKNWVGLEFLDKGMHITIHGTKWIVEKSVIHTGNPGKVQLTLIAIPKKQRINKDCKVVNSISAGFIAVAKTYKERKIRKHGITKIIKRNTIGE